MFRFLSAVVFFLTLFFRTYHFGALDYPIGETFSDLLLTALERPFNIFTPVVDGILILPRFLASVAILINEEDAARLLALFTIAIHAYISTYILKNEYESIFPSTFSRFAIASFIAFGPGSLTIAGNAICLSYLAAIFLCMLLIKPVMFQSRLDSALILILAFSSSFSIVTLPILIFRMLIFRNFRSVLYMFVVLLPVVVNFYFFSQSISRFTKKNQFSNVNFFQEFLGGLVYSMNYVTFLYFLVLIFLVVWLLTLYFSELYKKKYFFCLASGLFFISVLYVLMHAFFRPYGIGGLVERHAFMLLTPLVMSIAIIFSHSNQHGKFIKPNMILTIVIIPGILYQLLYTQERYTFDGASSWSAFYSNVKLLPENQSIKSYIAPKLTDVFWGEITCLKKNAFLQCQVANYNGIHLEYAFKGQ